jgi:hypothetical protein
LCERVYPCVCDWCVCVCALCVRARPLYTRPLRHVLICHRCSPLSLAPRMVSPHSHDLSNVIFIAATFASPICFQIVEAGVIPVLLKLLSNKQPEFKLDIDSQTNLLKSLLSLCFKRLYVEPHSLAFDAHAHSSHTNACVQHRVYTSVLDV